jgi:hypothetical protein
LDFQLMKEEENKKQAERSLVEIIQVTPCDEG